MGSVEKSYVSKVGTRSLDEKVYCVGKFCAKKSEFIGLLFFFFIFMVKGLGLYDGQKVFTIFLVGLLGLVFLKTLGEEFTVWELAFFAVLGMTALYSYSFSGDKGPLLCVAMMFMVKGNNLKKVCGVGAFSLGFFTILRGLAELFAGVHQRALLHDKLGGEILRYCFGQPHPNVLHMTFFVFSCMLLYTLRGKRKQLLLWNTLLLGANLLLFLYTVSYTGVALCVCLFGITLWADRFPKYHFFDGMISFGALAGTVSASVVFPLLVNYDNGFTRSLILSIYNRFKLLNAYFSAYSISLWGQNISDYTKVDYQLDNSWATLLLGSGAVLCCIMVVIYIGGLYLLARQGKKWESYMVVLFLLGGMADPYLFNTSLKNLSLVFLASAGYEYQEGMQGKRIILLPRIYEYLNQPMEIPCVTGSRKRSITTKRAFAAVAAGLVLAALVMCFVHMPRKYCVASRDKDPVRNESVLEEIYVTGEMLADPEIKVFGYQDAQSPMILIDSDRIRNIESARCYVGLAILLGLGGIGFAYAVDCRSGNRFVRR